MATLQNITTLVTGASRGIGPRNSSGACRDSNLVDCLVNAHFVFASAGVPTDDDVYLSNEADVLREMKSFFTTLR